MSGAYTGSQARQYHNTGTYALPTWTQIARVEDVDHADSRNVGTLKSRESDYEKELAATRKRGVTFSYIKKHATDAVFDALKNAYENKSIVDYVAMDRDIATSGAKGYRAPMIVKKFDEKQPFEGPVTVDVELALTDAQVPGGTTSWEPTAMTTA